MPEDAISYIRRVDQGVRRGWSLQLVLIEWSQAIGESIGVVARSEIAAKLAEDIEYRTREVIQVPCSPAERPPAAAPR